MFTAEIQTSFCNIVYNYFHLYFIVLLAVSFIWLCSVLDIFRLSETNQ